jgi:hypothetical protein
VLHGCRPFVFVVLFLWMLTDRLSSRLAELMGSKAVLGEPLSRLDPLSLQVLSTAGPQPSPRLRRVRKALDTM